MKVGVVTPTTSGGGGIEAVVQMHVSGLRARGHDVLLVTGPQLGSGALARALACLGLVVRRARALRGCDVVLAHYPPAHLLARRSGRPYVHYFHHPLRISNPHLAPQTWRQRVWHRLGRLVVSLDDAGVRAAHAVAVPTDVIGREARARHGVRARVLPLGVAAPASAPQAARDGLLFVGRPDAGYKHLDWAEEVSRRLGRRLDVVGKVPPGRHDEPHVRFLGFLTGQPLDEAYARARVLLFPSEREDYGLVPLEALAAGLPVVAWDDGCGPSSTLGTGSGGVLVPAYDLDRFTAEVRRLLEDDVEHARLSAQGPAWVRRRYSEAHHLAQLEELLHEAAGT